MIEFMIIAAPRSGTTWASNWLTTELTSCLHDPLWNHHYTDLDSMKSSKRLGVSCTGLFMFPDWVNNHPARKVILHRDIGEINASLNAIGLPDMTGDVEAQLNKIDGIHLDWKDIFDAPKHIYEYLLELPFDKERHELLKEIEMQPNFVGLKTGKHVTERIMKELFDAANKAKNSVVE